MSVATITAADPDGLQANQGFSVTVEAASTNQAPVAVGTIPGSGLEIGGTSTIDASGYFSDPDGDELSYTGASSNEAVATVAMDGSTATITAVAAGDAVITISASDGQASVSQGFRVTVGSGGRKATVAIFGLQHVGTGESVNPTAVSGNINVVLDVQNNDETVTAIALTLNDEVIQCRGTSADADPAGLAQSGGQLEVECLLQTATVDGECMGMQLQPKYANGDYDLSAFVTTDEGETRSATASQPITLKNSGFVMIAHSPGEKSVVSTQTEGLTFYGGPAGEGNVNSFHACPVSYTGTTVGEMQLGTIHTNTARPNPVPTDPQPAFGEGGLSFRRANGAPHFPADDEAPFTWPISTSWWTGNSAVENVPGESEFWIQNLGLIKNVDGLDVTGEFRHDTDGDGTVDTQKAGPFHFDFRAPRINQGSASEVVVSANFDDGLGRSRRNISDGAYYSDGSSSTPARLIVSNVAEAGVSNTNDSSADYINETIAVGDCTVPANRDSRPNTAFVATFDDIGNISELPEDDAVDDAAVGRSDDGGIECYFAELQRLEDALGNSTWLGNVRVQSGGAFGVDRTAPEVSRLAPDENVVLSVNAVTFEAEEPELATGEDGSGLRSVEGQRYRSGRFRSEVVSARFNDADDPEDVTIDVSDLGEGSQAVRGRVRDRALPANINDDAVFQFTRDTKAPTFTAGSGPGQVSAGSSDRVTVTVSGSIRDANVIEEARLSVWSNAGSLDVCGGEDAADSELPSSRVRAKDVENGTKRIDFEEAFTIRRAVGGSEELCFLLKATDVAVDADGDDDGANKATYFAGRFSVNWGIGITIDADPDGSITLNSDGELEVAEGASGTYSVVLDAVPAGEVTVTIGGTTGSNVAVMESSGTSDDGMLLFTAADWNAPQIVTVNAREDARDDDDPEDAADDMVTLTHSAAGGGYTGVSGSSIPVTVLDDDVKLTVSSHDITAGGTAVTVTITATLVRAIAEGVGVRTVTVAVAAGDDGDGGALAGNIVPIEIGEGDKSGTTTVEVTPGTSAGTLTVGTAADQVPATITIKASSG